MTAAEANGIAPPLALPPKCQRGPWLRAVLWGCAAGLLLAVAGNTLYHALTCNFHTVLPGQIYRCAQPSPKELERLIRKHDIRTVLNLRGCCDILGWYIAESRVTHRCNVNQEDVSLSASRFPSVHEMRRLVEVVDHSERPILIHCRRGADRTGLASAVVLLLHTDTSVKEARRQLSPRYGHVTIGKTVYLGRFFDLYEEWLAKQDQEHSPALFRCWATREYCPGAGRARIELAEPLRPLPARRPAAALIRVSNTSLRPWRLRPGSNAGFHAGYMLYDSERVHLLSRRAGQFDAQVNPGESIELKLVLPALAPGRYRLLVDMIEERHSWFYQIGSEPLEVEFEVREQETTAGGGSASPDMPRVADRLEPGR